MKRCLIFLAIVAGMTAMAGSAAAAPPDKFEGELPEAYTTACKTAGLPTLESSISGRAKVIDTGVGTTISTSPGTKVTLTNPDNDKTVSYVITGALHISEDAAGNTVYKATGRNLLTRTITDVGLYVTTGNFSFVVAPDGVTIVEEFDLDGPGRVIDVCAALS
jgi:hypothetical protein